MTLTRLFLLCACLFTGACATQQNYTYRKVPGHSGLIFDGKAFPPANAPERVVEAIVAANKICKTPYKWGGGHKQFEDNGYDCSGSAGYVLHAAGLLQSSMPSTGFRHYGESGPGKWISIYARTDHTFLVIADLRFDTGYGSTHGQGPRWSAEDRPAGGAVVRHPPGL
ncbi:MAG: hypothetical protein QOF32_1826 [Gammaproteobacteria bacterium]|jgi:hypothetical protein|nr:hypothetical protein [Gammaproteobacteria bacterium]